MQRHMAVTARAKATVATTVGATAIMLGAVAWACTAQPVIGTPVGGPNGGSALSPQSGPSTTQVRVDGRDFNAGPVEVRWNSAGGSELASPRPQGPSFSVTIVIPEASQGTHYVVAFQRDTAGNIDVIARAPFQVTAAGTAPGYASSGSASGASDSDAAGSTSASTEGDTAGAPSASGQPASGAQRLGSAPRSESPPAPAPAVTPVEPQPGQVRSAPAANAAAPSRTAAPAGAATPTPDGGATAAPAAPAVAVGALADEAPSQRSVSSDLWSGFADGSSRSVGLADTPRSSGSVPAPVVGAGVFAAGLVALFAGFGVAEARRRRVTVVTR